MAVPEEPGTGMDVKISRLNAHQAFTLAVIIGLLVLLYLAHGALAPYLLALLGIYTLLPVVRFIEDHLPSTGRWERFRRPVAVFGTATATVVIFGIVLGILVAPIIEQTAELFDNLDEY